MEKEKGDLPIDRTHALYIDIIFQWFKNNSFQWLEINFQYKYMRFIVVLKLEILFDGFTVVGRLFQASAPL